MAGARSAGHGLLPVDSGIVPRALMVRPQVPTVAVEAGSSGATIARPGHGRVDSDRLVHVPPVHGPAGSDLRGRAWAGPGRPGRLRRDHAPDPGRALDPARATTATGGLLSGSATRMIGGLRSEAATTATAGRRRAGTVTPAARRTVAPRRSVRAAMTSMSRPRQPGARDRPATCSTAATPCWKRSEPVARSAG
jgi:hypothetical protein